MATLFCDPSLATGSDDGTSWEDAYQGLQAAIDAGGSGDEVWVKSRSVTLSSTIDFDNANAISVYGGFDNALTGTNGSVAGRDLPTDITTLDGNASVRCIYVTTVVTIDGFKITNGLNTSLGAGMWVFTSSGTVAINNCIVDDNNGASGTGGGLYQSGGGTLTMDNTDFTNNNSSLAGALYVTGSTCTLINATVSGNSSTSTCGGCQVVGSGGSLTLTDCSIDNNTNGGYTGGATNCSSPATLTCNRCYFDTNTGSTVGGAGYASGTTKWINCIFANNTTGYGGGLYLIGGTHTITNCTSSDNNGSSAGGFLRNTGGATTTIVNCILYGDTQSTSTPNEFANAATLTVSYSDIEGGWTGTANIDTDPSFLGSGNDPYDLNSSGTPVDSGNAGATDYPSTDYLGRSRVDDPGSTTTGVGSPDYSDMGAYEYQVAAAPGGSSLLCFN